MNKQLSDTLCACGIASVYVQVTDPEKETYKRWFLACSKQKQDKTRCKFFKWTTAPTLDGEPDDSDTRPPATLPPKKVLKRKMEDSPGEAAENNTKSDIRERVGEGMITICKAEMEFYAAMVEELKAISTTMKGLAADIHEFNERSKPVGFLSLK